MSVVARVFQLLFLVPGLLLLLASPVVAVMSDDSQEVTGFGWACRPEGNGGAVTCDTDNYIYAETGGTDTPILTALIGIGLLVASASVAVGGRRADAGASGGAVPGPMQTVSFGPQR